jgi:membrane-associated phospholipid phosphatase
MHYGVDALAGLLVGMVVAAAVQRSERVEGLSP